MKKILIGALALVCTIAVAQGLVFQDKGKASLIIKKDENGHVFSTLETRYFPNYQADAGMEFYKTVSKESFSDYSEGAKAASTITRIAKTAAGEYKPVWSVNADGTNFKVVSEELVSTTTYGCCGAESISHLRAMQNGKLVASVIEDNVFTAEVPNSKLAFRYIGLAFDAKQPYELNGRNYLGTVLYFSAKKVLQTTHIYISLSEGWGASFQDVKPFVKAPNSVGYQKRIELWGSDRATDPQVAYTNFGLNAATSFDNTTIQFFARVQGDRMSITTDSPQLVRFISE